MKYTMTTPCSQCPFLKSLARGFPLKRLEEFASAEFPCHKTAEVQESDDDDDGDFIATEDSQHCAGSLIYLEKRGRSHQMMRICERMGGYDRTKLDMKAKVR
jgi:hypothetical protein